MADTRTEIHQMMWLICTCVLAMTCAHRFFQRMSPESDVLSGRHHRAESVAGSSRVQQHANGRGGTTSRTRDAKFESNDARGWMVSQSPTHHCASFACRCANPGAFPHGFLTRLNDQAACSTHDSDFSLCEIHLGALVCESAPDLLLIPHSWVGRSQLSCLLGATCSIFEGQHWSSPDLTWHLVRRTRE